MPFTFAHPVIYLPLKYLPRSWFSSTGVIVGSVAPDLEYIFYGTRTFSHTYAAILWFHLPLALLIAWLFHNLLRDKLIGRLPTCMHSRFVRYEGFSWNKYFKKNLAVVILSILLGALTHLLWDGFTNPAGYFVEQFPVLLKTVHTLGTHMPLHVLIWNISSIVGILALMFAIYLMPADLKTKPYSAVWFWITFVMLAGMLSLLLRIKVQYGDMSVVYMICLRSGLLALVLIALLSRKKTTKVKNSGSNVGETINRHQ